ncbi:MAG: twin-arginine translocase subunit TatC [Desulfobacteraceae bacterium]|nr:twin-arginine translocase subunit TatC [Desulfobacteraceae bacterium]
MGVLNDHFAVHLIELRRRLIVSFVAIAVCSVVAYFFAQPITGFFVAPLFRAHAGMGKLVYTNLTEAFVAYFKIALLVGLIFSSPVLLYELWMFVSPGLHRHERRLVLKIVGTATLLFVGGAAFAYFVVLPDALSFLMGFASERLKALPKFDAYLTFMARSTLAFGLAFEVPFLMVAAHRTGLVSRDHFRKKRLYFYAAIVGLAFLLTVGDIFSAVLLALPLFGLYEAGLLVIRLFSSPA